MDLRQPTDQRIGSLIDPLGTLALAFADDARLLSIRISGLPTGLLAWRAEGCEGVSTDYQVAVDCLSADALIELKSLLGRPAEVTIRQADGGERAISGLIAEAAQTGADGGFARYRLTLVPGLALLAHRRNSRVFQNLSVPQIVEHILGEHRDRGGPWAAACRWQSHLQQTYPVRSTCVQYRESDQTFIRRLLAEEGIATRYAFSRAALSGDAVPTHTLVLFDDPYEPPACAQPRVRFHRADASEADDTVTDWQAARQLRTASVQLASFDYKPVSTLQGEAWTSGDQGTQGTAVESLLADYAPQTHYYGQGPDDVARYATLRQAALDRHAKSYAGTSRVRALGAGEWFQLVGHPRHDGFRPDDACFLVRELTWRARNNLAAGVPAPLAGLLAGALAGLRGSQQPSEIDYESRVVAVRRDTPVAPDIALHPRPTAPGLQTATVVGPDGEAIHTDELGRIKVQFHWVRPADHPDGGAAFDDRSGAWLRVLTTWAGDGWGQIQLPRIGQEVLIDFLEGDIDRPVIVGSLYNGQHTPPQFSEAGSLPANRALAGIRSQEIGGTGANQLLFDDTSGQVRAQLSSSHAATQLNLGYLTHPRREGEAEPRGEGFELRTDAAGTLRAAKGLYLSADAQPQAGGAQMDRTPALRQLEAAGTQAQDQGQTAARHNAEAATPDDTDWAAEGEPQIVVSAPAGIALATPQAIVLTAGQDLHQTSGRDTQQTTVRRWIHNVGEQISLFVNGVRGVREQTAVKLFAAQGDVSVQAQGGNLELAASRDVTVTSTQERIVVAAKEHITLTSGGAYIKLAGGNIEIVAPGMVKFGAAQYDLSGPGSMEVPLPQFPGEVCRECLLKAMATGSPFIAPNT